MSSNTEVINLKEPINLINGDKIVEIIMGNREEKSYELPAWYKNNRKINDQTCRTTLTGDRHTKPIEVPTKINLTTPLNQDINEVIYTTQSGDKIVKLSDGSIGSVEFNEVKKPINKSIFTIRDQIDDFTQTKIPIETTHLIASNCGLISLRGLDHLTNLEDLDVSGNNLIDLAFCPKFIKKLNCANNLLTSLDGCPVSVTHLRCSRNKIVSLLGLSECKSLVNIGCSQNHMKTLIGCPDSVKELVSAYNFIESFLGLPKVMSKLYISYNQIKSMKNCPITSNLDCSCNLITSLQYAPEGIIDLTISNNPLGTLTGCPTSIQFIRCSDCKLTSIEGRPAQLKLLEATKNNLTGVDVGGIDEPFF